jgi:hypothetical protein
VVAVALSEEKAELEPVLTKLGIKLSNKEFMMDIKPLVRTVLNRLLGDTSCLVD